MSSTYTYEPTCPLCHGSITIFDQPESGTRYLCARCKKLISIEDATEVCEVMGA